jgi:secondary thiamine-phosphate synthase enzyme
MDGGPESQGHAGQHGEREHGGRKEAWRSHGPTIEVRRSGVQVDNRVERKRRGARERPLRPPGPCYVARMKSHTEYLTMEVPGRRGFVHLTPRVEEAVRKSGVREGLVLVNAMHISASVFINDDEPGLHHDYEEWLERLAPHAPVSQYRHNDTGEDNADAHLKRQVMGREVVVAITDGHLDFGPWERIFYGEFDGRRRKRVLIKVIGE